MRGAPGRWGARGVISMLASDHEWEGFGAGEVGYLVLPTLAAACALTLPLLTRWPRWLRTVGVVIVIGIVIVVGGARPAVLIILTSSSFSELTREGGRRPPFGFLWCWNLRCRRVGRLFVAV